MLRLDSKAISWAGNNFLTKYQSILYGNSPNNETKKLTYFSTHAVLSFTFSVEACESSDEREISLFSSFDSNVIRFCVCKKCKQQLG